MPPDDPNEHLARFFKDPTGNILHPGSRGTACANIRLALSVLGYDVGSRGEADEYDQGLELAVQQFQVRVGHKYTDGRVGHGTRDQLVQALLNQNRGNPDIFQRFSDPASPRRPDRTTDPKTDSRDVFISFKNLDDMGKPTRDSQLAREVHDYLTARGLRVFFSPVSLEESGVAQYAKAIEHALDEAKVLVAVGTSAENLESEWVYYEWHGFLLDILRQPKSKKRLFSYIEGFNEPDLPRGLRQNQCFSHGQDGLEKLHRFVCNALGHPHG